MMLLWVQAQAACPTMGATLESATSVLIDGGDSTAALAEVETVLACRRATRAELARLWLLRGAALQLSGDLPAAEPFYAAALAADATWFDDRLGSAVREAWARARNGLPSRLSANRPLEVDGVPIGSFPATLASGPHALQAPDVRWARVVVMAPGEESAVEVPLTPLPDPNAEVRPRKGPGWLVAGGALLAGAVGVGVAAAAQSEVMSGAETTTALDEAWTTQQALGFGSIGLAALGSTGVVLHVVLP
ncbi:MAG: hypothetical protein EXR71_11095 [Myxococcales bacterium]|nr:hypothetical protein [Myxococcales bacterium]